MTIAMVKAFCLTIIQHRIAIRDSQKQKNHSFQSGFL